MNMIDTNLWDSAPLIVRDCLEVTFEVGKLLLDFRTLLSKLLNPLLFSFLAVNLAFFVHSEISMDIANFESTN